MTKTITLTPVADVAVNTPFTVGGAYKESRDLTFKDDNGTAQAFPAGSTVPSTAENFSFPHAAFTTSGAHTVEVDDPASGANATVSVTVTGGVSVVYITPGNGSFTDAAGHVFTVDANNNAMENGSPMADGAGTGQMAYKASTDTVYGQDQATGNWYTWNGSGWNAASAPE